MKATGMTNLNGDNNVMFGMTIPIGRKRSGQSSWCCSTQQFEYPGNDADVVYFFFKCVNCNKNMIIKLFLSMIQKNC